MNRTRYIERSRVLNVSLVLVLALDPVTLAQKAPDRVDSPSTTTGARPRPTIVTNRSTGALSVVVGIPGARVQLFGVVRNGKTVPRETAMADGDGFATFSLLRPGTYRVVVSSADHDDVSADVRVTAGKVETISGRPVPRFGYLVLIRPELTDDTVLEIDGNAVDRTQIDRLADGTARIKQPLGTHQIRILKPGFEPYVVTSEVVPGGDAMVAPTMERQWTSFDVRGAPGTRVYLDRAPAGIIPTTGRIELTRLMRGQTYELRFELNDFQPLQRTAIAGMGTTTVIEANLEPLPTDGAFEDSFLAGLSAWEAPSGWRASNGVLFVEGTGVGVARNSLFRDFELIFGVRLALPKGAAWILRAKDARNYYLFVLGGPSAKYANQLRTYVVRDGEFDPDAPASTLPLVESLTTTDTYRIRISVSDNVIQHWITPSSTGEEVSVGLFADVHRQFTLGRIGFAAPFGERFQINGITARPSATR